MKKFVLTIITLSIINLAGCYDPDTATVRINLGNIPIAKHEPKSLIDKILGLFEKEAWAQTVNDIGMGINKVHIAAYSGNTVLTTLSFDSTDIQVQNVGAAAPVYQSYIELTVPAGNDIAIFVVGEHDTLGQNNEITARSANYYGYGITNVNAGETADVTVTMESAIWSTGGAGTNKSIQTLSWMPHTLNWEIPGAGVKALYYLYDNNRVLLYKGYESTVTVNYSGNQFYFYVEFEPFNLKTVECSHNDT